MIGAQIPDWFDHRCDGRVFSFWARGTLPNATFAFIHSESWSDLFLIGDDMNHITLHLFINGIDTKRYTSRICDINKECHVRFQHLSELMDSGWGNVQIDLLPSWNHVEIKVEHDEHEVFDVTKHQCGIYVYEQGTNMENVQFKNPNSAVFTELVPRNVLKRGEAFHPDSE